MADRIAVMGDVHANLPALQAVVAAIAAHDLPRGACTGDLVMRGPAPEGCVALMQRLGWPCVMGNTDRKVARRPPRPPAHPKAQRVGSRAWTTNQLSPASLDYLAGLPMVWRLRLGPHVIAVVHGAPDDPRRAIDERTPDRDVRRMVAALGNPDCIVSGHTHRAVVRRVDGCLLVNPGSVGETLDPADPRPSWGWLETSRRGLQARLEHIPAAIASFRA